MAVVQISRIQVRRGRKNNGSGLPQLASGELGWAIDTRELYIGNGAVSEGAPAVGNTKVLTEHDNIFEFANTYTYKVDRAYIQTGESSSTPIQRSLQDRLDEIVSIRSFGATGESGTDVTSTLQRAIDNLYINNSTKTNLSTREVLYIPAGVYEISNTIYLPPYVTIRGAGKEKTKIIMSGATHAFETVNFTSQPGAHATDHSSDDENNQAKYISITDCTIEHTQEHPVFVLHNCKFSNFGNLELIGAWETTSALNEDSVAFKIISSSYIATTSKENDFFDCTIRGFSNAFYSVTDTNYNTFRELRIKDCGNGFVFGDQNTKGSPGPQVFGPSNNSIQNCNFIDINFYGINIDAGRKNIISGNSFVNVANAGNGTEENPIQSIIRLVDLGNIVADQDFDRTTVLAPHTVGVSSTVPYVPEVEGSIFYTNNSMFEVNVVAISANSPASLFRLPAAGVTAYELDYYYVADSANNQGIRIGKLFINVDPTAIGNEREVTIQDDYTWTGAEENGDALRFFVELTDLDNDTFKETLLVRYSNALQGDTGSIKFRINSHS